MSDRTPPDWLLTLADFAARTPLRALSPAALHKARWILADCVPVIAAGMQQPEMRAFAARHCEGRGPGRAWVIGTSRRADPLDAALLGGTAGTWLELDEGNLYSHGHPGIQIVPGAVAYAQHLGANGADLLRAIALGYEVSARISRACAMHLTIHPHGTYGVIGTAVAAACLRGFDPAQMREVLNVAATMGMATSRQTLLDGATVRNIFTGHSGYMGLTAARLVECGFTGEVDSFRTVYGKIYADHFEPQRVIDGLGEEWLIALNYFKLYPTGRYVHSVIDALLDLLGAVPGGRLAPATIARIEVKAYARAAMLAEKSVVSSFGARFSVPFALATLLHHGGSSLAAFEQSAVDNPEIQALAARVDLQADASFTHRYPAEQPVDLKIVLHDGSTYEGHCTITRGEPAAPHSDDELKQKFRALGTPIWGDARTRHLLEGLLDVERIEDFGAFSEGLQPVEAAG
ncbi:MAG: MmgE/PrpD family protein [Proteobacteria bacterium]|nr:MmgE/PrpD family protein [Burkholderiales bacterium]